MTRDDVVRIAAEREIPSYARMDVVAAHGEGSWIVDLDGTRYLDLYGGHAVAILGHSPARVVDAIANQARDLLFYSNAVHAPARARAAERLCRLAPWEDARVFFVGSGAEANETALKIARKATGRTAIASYEGGFHGRTLGVLAAAGLDPYPEPARGVVQGVRRLRWGETELDETVAAVIVEPVQSMGGVRVMTGDFARALRRRCDETGALLVFDEVQTAPARTGTWFAGERWGVRPDIVTTAKGVAAGFPAGAVLARGGVAETVRPGDQGTTFGGGPVACAAIDETLAMLEEIDGPARARAIEERVRGALGERAEVRGLGALLGVVAGERAKEAQRRLRDEHRILVGGCPGDPAVLRLLPPLTTADDDLDRALAAIREVLA